MIDTNRIEAVLAKRFTDVERLPGRILRAVDFHHDTPYAVHYFDLNDELCATAERLQEYQDGVLGKDYFDRFSSNDLRWNHYLYFITSKASSHRHGYDHAKRSIELDRQYTRKHVWLEDELERAIHLEALDPSELSLAPKDLMESWAAMLNASKLLLVLDESVQVPEVVRRIERGETPSELPSPLPAQLTLAEQVAGRSFLSTLSVDGFRQFPTTRHFEFGAVNLITGANAAGKTSLLEAIEYLYCGRNRRGGSQDDVPKNTSISGGFSGSDAQLTTSYDTPLWQLRLRHLSWYGVRDVKTVTAQESFGKYNFLDSDAAVGLTLEQSEERIGSDVLKLVLGAQAVRAQNRLERVHEQLVARARAFESEARSARTQVIDAETQLTYLESLPRNSDQIHSELSIALGRLKWRLLPEAKQDSDRWVEPIQAALDNSRALERMQLPLALISESGLLAAHSDLLNDLSTAQNMITQEGDSRRQGAAVARQMSIARTQLEALERLERFAKVGFEGLMERERFLTDSVHRLTRRLEVGKVAAELALPLAEMEECVGAAGEVCRRRLVQCRHLVSSTKEALDRLVESQTVLANLRQELVNAAQQLISHTKDHEHCPICQTVLQSGVLLRKMALVVDPVAAEASAQLRRDHQSAIKAAEVASAEVTALDALLAFVGVSESRRVTVSQALAAFDATDQQLGAERRELQSIRTRLNEMERDGLTPSRLTELKTAVQVDGEVLAVPGLLTRSASLRTMLEGLSETSMAIERECSDLDMRIRDLARRSGIDVLPSRRDLTSALAEQREHYEQALVAVRLLSKEMTLENPFAPAELSARLTGAQALLGQFKTALAQERSVESHVIGEKNRLARHQEALISIETRSGRIDGARAVITKLLETHSNNQHRDQVLRENSAAIASIFSSIHSPREFAISGSHLGLTITRVGSNKVTNLSQMSTGQRAAYALSLFLAMNARLRGSQSPKVLLFDDPIAHIDDINVLSFLDHLRKLALYERRQIFFATADTRLAGVFRRKFGFLGDSFREIGLTRD